MVREELINKLRESHTKMGELEGDELKKERAHFDEIKDEIDRLDAVTEREAEIEHEKETQDNDLWRVFGKAMRGENLSGNERAALAVRDQNLADSAGDGAFRLPGNGYKWFDGYQADVNVERAVLGQVSSDIDLVPQEATAPVHMLPLAPAPLFDRATKVPALNGVYVPFLDQTVDDPFASVTIASGTGEGDTKTSTDLESGTVKITTQEYNAYTIVSDLALKRVPEWPGLIAQVFRAALAYEVNGDIIDDLQGSSMTAINRDTANEVEWGDVVNLEEGIPWYWSADAEYCMSQEVRAFLKAQVATTGGPLFNQTTAEKMYSTLNGYRWFVDEFPDLGSDGDIVFGNFAHIYVGVGQDIVFRSSSQGHELMSHNSTGFYVFAHIGVDVPVPGAFAELDASTTDAP